MFEIIKKNKITLLASCATFVISGLLAQGSYAQNLGSNIVNAANSDNASEVIQLIGSGEDVNSTGRFGVTALHRAAYNDSTEIGEALISAGAALNPKDAGGATPLHVAARQGNVDFIKLLLKNGANINDRDNEGFTPLQRAIASDNDDAAVTLIAFGADVNISNNAGQSAVATATERNNQMILAAINGPKRSTSNAKGSDVVAAPIMQVSETSDMPAASQPMINKAVAVQASANQLNNELVLNDAAPIVVTTPASMAVSPAKAAQPGGQNLIMNNDAPKGFRFSKNNNSSIIVPSPVATTPEPVSFNPAPAVHSDVSTAVSVAPVVEEPIQVSSPQPTDVAPAETIPPVNIQTGSTTPDYNMVINLDRGPEGVRANGVLVQPAESPALNNIQPAQPVSEVVVPMAEPLAVEQQAAHVKKKVKELPKSMQVEQSAVKVSATSPVVQSLQKQESIAISDPEKEWSNTVKTTAISSSAQPLKSEEADPLEKKANALISEPVKFNKYENNPEVESTAQLGYASTLDKINSGRTNNVTPKIDDASLPAEKHKPATSAVSAEDNSWGGLSEDDINKMNSQINRENKPEKPAAKKTKKQIKESEAGLEHKDDFNSVLTPEELNKKTEQTLSKKFDEPKTEVKVKTEVPDTITAPAPIANAPKLPDEKQADVAPAKLIATNQNKKAEIPVVKEEEMKAPEMPEITPPSIDNKPADAAKPEAQANKVEEKKADALALPELPALGADKPAATAKNEMPALPALGAKAAEPVKETEAKKTSAPELPSDKEFEDKLKTIDKQAAPAKNDKFSLNESISATELEAQDKPKSVFDDIKKMSDSSTAAELYAVIGSFGNGEAAVKYYNNIAGKTGLVYPYKVVKSATDSKTYLQLGPVDSVKVTDELCASFAVESKTCKVPTISDEDKKFMKGLKTLSSKKIYSLVGNFKTEKEAKEYYAKTTAEKPLSFKYQVSKTSKSGVYGIQVGPLASGNEAKDACDVLKTEKADCVISVK